MIMGWGCGYIIQVRGYTYGRDMDTASVNTLLITQQVAQTRLARLFTYLKGTFPMNT